MRFNLELDVSFIKQLSDDALRRSFDTEMTIILPTDDLNGALSYHTDYIVIGGEDWQVPQKWQRMGCGDCP